MNLELRMRKRIFNMVMRAFQGDAERIDRWFLSRSQSGETHLQMFNGNPKSLRSLNNLIMKELN